MALCLVITSADAINPPPHYQENCITCHQRMVSGNGDLLYQRDNRLVNNFDALKKRVNACARSVGVESKWGEKQMAEVINYLNQSFYHFPRPEKN